jgi:hypothetical protein
MVPRSRLSLVVVFVYYSLRIVELMNTAQFTAVLRSYPVMVAKIN